MKLIIQIPCFNEEATLAETVADLPRQIAGIDAIEYLIIDDGSTDNTVDVAKAAGINHVVRFKQNKGLAEGFKAGLDACLRLGADIVVNTDADNQYCGADIAELVKPILAGKADIVIGERPIDDTEHFSATKKRLQHVGSFVVRVASGTDVPDAPSGFRAYSREAALRLNVINSYTYTLETIIQAGHSKIAMATVPIRTNPETRKSRLFKSPWAYIKRSATVIIRSFLMYKPMRFFCTVGVVLLAVALAIAIRYLVYFFGGSGAGHVQSLLLSILFALIGVQCVVAGLQADLISTNRKILQELQYRMRKMDYAQDAQMAEGSRKETE